MKEGLKGFLKRHQVAVLITAFILLMVIILFGTQIVLFVNFILGNDIVVKLSANQETIKLVHQQEGKVIFESSVTTNPFCSAECTSEFKDLGNEKVVAQEQFSLNAGISKKQEFKLSSLSEGVGYNLYQFRLQCYSVESWLCNTNGKKTTRNILITVFTNLTSEEAAFKHGLNEQLSLDISTIENIDSKTKMLRNLVLQLNQSLIVDSFFSEIEDVEKRIEEEKNILMLVQAQWDKQQYFNARQILSGLKLNETLSLFNNTYSAIETLSSEDRKLHLELDDARLLLINMTMLPFDNESVILEVNDTINEYNNARILFNEKNNIDSKRVLIETLLNKTIQLGDRLNFEYKEKPVRLALMTDVMKDTLCTISGSCLIHPPVIERIGEVNISLNNSCFGVDLLHEEYLSVNHSMSFAFTNQSYPETDTFWKDMSVKVRTIRRDIAQNYINNLVANGTNLTTTFGLLDNETIESSQDYLSYNITPALVFKLGEFIPAVCAEKHSVFTEVNNDTLVSYSWPMPEVSLWNITFAEPKAQCCVLGKCAVCCEGKCLLQEKNYPIVFLHGHAFNKAVSTEYSLDAFNYIQEKLEQEGYVNGGAISLYTGRDTPQGEWGLFNVPLTVKASYYYDFFKTPQNYVIVQQKSESIDTYAVRLKELVDTISYKTGRPKVVIVAHSMGGLVARRYLQLFGEEKVAKLITIGTPHQGITQEVFDNCNLVGEERECRDMKEDSAFMSKLKSEGKPSIPIYTIIGEGCSMKRGDGDGVVLKENGVLPGAKSYYVQGICSGLYPLHTKLLDVNTYPEVYGDIKKALVD